MKYKYLHFVDEAYHLYRDRTMLTHPDSGLMKSFKKSYGIDDDETIIKFIGVWDTVGALGVPLRWFNGLNKKYEFHDVKLSSQIKYAYHALAIDERRKIFEPTLWEVNEKALTAPDPQVAEQVWFPGVHSNVGGGYADSGLSDTTLQWMINKASATGLDFDKNYAEKIKANSAGELRKSDGGIYNISPKIFREINNGVAIRTDPDTGKQSKVKVLRNESIHYTYFQRHHTFNKYKPQNVVHALTLDTPYDPVTDKWEEGWREYIK